MIWVQVAELYSLRKLRVACIHRLALLLASPHLRRAPAISVSDSDFDSSSESSSSSDASEAELSEDSLLPPAKHARLKPSAVRGMQLALEDAAKLQASQGRAWPAQACSPAPPCPPPASLLRVLLSAGPAGRHPDGRDGSLRGRHSSTADPMHCAQPRRAGIGAEEAPLGWEGRASAAEDPQARLHFLALCLHHDPNCPVLGRWFCQIASGELCSRLLLQWMRVTRP